MSENEPAAEPTKPGFFAKIKTAFSEGMDAQKELGRLKKSSKADEETTEDLKFQQAELVVSIGELVVDKGLTAEFPEQDAELKGLDKQSRTVENDLAESKKGLAREEAAIGAAEEEFGPKIQAADSEVRSAEEAVAGLQREIGLIDTARAKMDKEIVKLGSQIGSAAGADGPSAEVASWEEERAGHRGAVAELLKEVEAKGESLEGLKGALAKAKGVREALGDKREGKLKPHKEKLETYQDAMPPLEKKLSALASQRKACIECLGEAVLGAKLGDEDIDAKVAEHVENRRALEDLAVALGDREEREEVLKPAASKMKILIAGVVLVVILLVVLAVYLVKLFAGD